MPLKDVHCKCLNSRAEAVEIVVGEVILSEME